ncbi:MAG: arginine N-succinyltransferase [Elusimicrobia bacterium]|nr:arginine N-succinyltransferase [Elusimicrobiota bacterium]
MTAPSNFLLRSARLDDLDDVVRLARHLDSYNLPADRARLRTLLSDSARSFGGRPPSHSREKFLFLLEDRSLGRVVGSSLVIAQHGTPGLPHLFLQSFVERRRSRTLRRSVEHRCLKMGWTDRGPTELGGLVLLPSHRGRPEKLGHWLSYVRLLFIATRRRRFRPRLLAEYLPAFAKNGVSPFWEYFGKKFTGLDYRTADRLSIDNKEFIVSLFPTGTLYQDFFPADVVRYLGQVGNPSLPAAQLLRKVGFAYCSQIEPFDGGPYFEADTDRVPLVRGARRTAWAENSPPGKTRRLVLVDRGADVRALVAPAALRGGRLLLSPDASASLSLRAAETPWSVGIDR